MSILVDGNWAAWGSWGSCSVTCASSPGTKQRTRTCSDPAPANNGLDCVGSATETGSCTVSLPCPIDGNWGSWSSWTSCSVTCGYGTESRNRSCDSPAPQYNGNNCTGDGEETNACWSGTCYPSILGNLDLFYVCSFRCDGTRDCDDGSDENVAIAGCVFCSSGAGPDNQGREFIIGFMDNIGTNNNLELFITTTSNNNANVNITTPLYNPSFLSTVVVSRGNIVKQELTNGLRGSGVEMSNKAIRITASEEVTVYGVNKEQYSTDGFVALPVDTLGTEYVAVTWTDKAELMIIATEDNTAVSITFPSTSPGTAISITIFSATYGNGDTLNITMNKYETLHFYQAGADFTGTRVLSSRPVSVMSGNSKVKVVDTGTGSSSDHLVEQLLPTDTWGKEFFTVSTPDRTLGDYYRVVACQDSTILSTVNLGNHTLNAYEYVQLNVPTGSFQSIISNKPVMVVMFGKTIGSPADGVNGGDPHMSIFPPIQQFPSDYTWSTVETPTGDFTNYLVVVIKDSLKSDLYLDNTQITSASWSSISGTTPALVTATFNVNPGSHSIYHSNPASTFMGLAFGNAQTNSYAYAAGMRMATINSVNDDGDGLIDEDLAIPPRVDGNWATWGSWGSCSVTCGTSTGIKARTRTCTDPAPANNVDGNWANWGSWSSCSVTCGDGTYTRTRTCDNPAPQHGGANCTGSDSETDPCNNGTCYPSVLGNLQRNCTRKYFGCKAGQIMCIDFAFRCDGQADCDDGSDEDALIAGCVTCPNSATTGTSNYFDLDKNFHLFTYIYFGIFNQL
ncbi:hypothetical protein KUTeg_018083 [Tegillarca granosa]|uniref:IgGFc-binding protein N-terminal domain-containing protein n=1 Tax=Tegillarca granosa TaxID=220873 RepID=A0ABQ9EM58_TEGGR|nr:hypothetical protein KUTeg_018083 [Tegillarca granosa]